ncbi:MAG: hypothetical protein R2878_13760 [Thermoleophilia bacterium]
MTVDARLSVIAQGGIRGVLEAHRALDAGGDVLLIDPDVDIAHELALKQRAERLERLVLGPGAGHCRLHGVDVGYANALAPGEVGIISASGSAARELAVLLDREGIGISTSCVTGPRDLFDEVGAAGGKRALEVVRRDLGTRVLSVVPWPGDRESADRLVSLACRPERPVVVCAFGEPVLVPPGATVVDTLDAAALTIARLLGRSPTVPAPGRPRWVSGGLVRGLYSGAGLCAEAVWVLSERLGEVLTNVRSESGTPLDEGRRGRAHVCVDLGDPAISRPAQHPMLSGAVRSAALRELIADPSVRVVLLDIVLGHGLPEDPVGELADAIAELLRTRPQVSVLAHVVGTERDGQGLAAQERRLSELGARVVSSNAAAARLAAALVS